MTCEEAYSYLMKISWKLGTAAIENISSEDRIRFREAVQTLYSNIVCSDSENER